MRHFGNKPPPPPWAIDWDNGYKVIFLITLVSIVLLVYSFNLFFDQKSCLNIKNISYLTYWNNKKTQVVKRCFFGGTDFDHEFLFKNQAQLIKKLQTKKKFQTPFHNISQVKENINLLDKVIYFLVPKPVEVYLVEENERDMYFDKEHLRFVFSKKIFFQDPFPVEEIIYSFLKSKYKVLEDKQTLALTRTILKNSLSKSKKERSIKNSIQEYRLLKFVKNSEGVKKIQPLKSILSINE